MFLRECLWGRPWNLSKEKVRILVPGIGNDGEKAAGPFTGSLEEIEGLLESEYRG